MSVKVVNIILDELEFAFALSKKNGRTWKAIFLDGLEYKAYSASKVATVPILVEPTKVGTYKSGEPYRKHKRGHGPIK